MWDGHVREDVVNVCDHPGMKPRHKKCPDCGKEPDMKRTHVGVSPHRLRDNPREKEFADAWRAANERGSLLDYLLHHPERGGRPQESTPEEDRVAATVIQWLGSPVGQNFLADLGYEKKTRS